MPVDRRVQIHNTDEAIVSPTNPFPVTGSLTGGSIVVGGSLLTIKSVKVDLSASADLISAVTAKKLRVISGWLTVAGNTTLKFQSGASTDLTGAATVKNGGGFVWPTNTEGWFGDTTSGEKLNLVLGTAVQVSGRLFYVEV